MDAYDRFRAKCRFDPATGCVLWTGGTTSGHGNTARYGAFWYEGRRWYAHRWAAVYIHRLDCAGLQVGHCCPHGPNTLCVEHVEPQTQLVNLSEQMARGSGACVPQAADERQHWLFVSLGIREVESALAAAVDDVPFYAPPRWLGETVIAGVDCPF